eukprot:1117776-Pelagomonas_calceolata.AAC.10
MVDIVRFENKSRKEHAQQYRGVIHLSWRNLMFITLGRDIDLTRRLVRVYQEGQPRWAVPSPVDEAPMLHLSYHDGMVSNCFVTSANRIGMTCWGWEEHQDASLCNDEPVGNESLFRPVRPLCTLLHCKCFSSVHKSRDHKLLAGAGG